MNKHRPILLDEILETLQGAKIDGFGNFIEKETAKQQLLAEVLDVLRELHKNSASGSTTHDCSQDGYEYGLEDAIKAAKEMFK